MNSTASIALSGLHAARTALNVSAHNVANLASDGYRRQQVVLTAQGGGGVAASVERADIEGPALLADVVARIQAKNALLANLAVFKTADRIAGTLLDTRA